MGLTKPGIDQSRRLETALRAACETFGEGTQRTEPGTLEFRAPNSPENRRTLVKTYAEATGQTIAHVRVALTISVTEAPTPEL